MPQTRNGLRYIAETPPKNGKPAVWIIEFINTEYDLTRIYFETKKQAIEYLRNMNPAEVRDSKMTTALNWDW